MIHNTLSKGVRTQKAIEEAAYELFLGQVGFGHCFGTQPQTTFSG